jgi:methyl-accepting chemotaxis protein
MDPNTRSGWTLGAQVNMLVLAATLVPAVTILGLGFWSIGQVTASGSATTSTTLWAATLIVAVVTVVAVALSTLRMRSVMRARAMELTEIFRQISMGARELRAPVAGEDEFSMLGAAANALLDGTPAVASRALSAGDGQDAAVLQAQIEKLLQEVSAVSDGDLRVQAEVTPDTLGVLADSFNYMIEELAKVVGRVQATTLQVTNATRRLLDRSAEVSVASEAQAKQISQTSESVARLADFVQLSATTAIQTAEAAKEALRNSQAGQQAVAQTIDGMVHIRENVQETSKKIKRLGERSQEVSEIVRLIEDIADQTNLLALNAAIQSAMAGEHGRGFAVVADEIRVLAERVTEATKRIATIVKSIQGDTYEAVVAMEESTQEVVTGSRLADDAGRALQSIYGAVERQTQMIEGIARAAGDRKQTAEAVSAAMNQIADITNQTNSATQDTTTSVSYLAELAEQLRASVATFRLPEQIAEAAGLMQPSTGLYESSSLDFPQLGGNWGNGGGAGQFPALPAGPSVTTGVSGGASVYEQNGYTQNGYGQNGFGQDGYGQNSYGQNDYGQNGYEGFDYQGLDLNYPPQPPQPQQNGGYPDEQYPSGPLGNPPFPQDLY